METICRSIPSAIDQSPVHMCFKLRINVSTAIMETICLAIRPIIQAIQVKMQEIELVAAVMVFDQTLSQALRTSHGIHRLDTLNKFFSRTLFQTYLYSNGNNSISLKYWYIHFN